MNNHINLPEINQEQTLNLSKFFIKTQQNLFLFGRRGVGKMLDLETELPTSTGLIKLKDLKEGDQLFDENGDICNVIKLHPINNSPESYQIIFDDGNTVNACADHLWLTWDKKSRKNKNFKPQVRSTKEILNTLFTNSFKKETNHSILVSKPIKYNNQNLLIDPYVLGCWLGDGQTNSGSIECADLEILEEIEKSGYSIHKTHKNINNKSKSSNYRIGDLIKIKYTKIGRLKKELQELNILNNKHIPNIYLYSSIEQRLRLLQGLLDTDGCCNKNGRIEFSSKLPHLSYQVKQLVESLGIKCSIHCNDSFFNGKKYNKRYRVSFITKLPVFKLKRKLANIKKSSAQDNRHLHRYIKNIIPIKPIPMRCITVDSKSSLFLITKSFIPTHNTHIAFQAARESNCKISYINLSVIERPDLAGYPDINSPGDIITFKSPYYLPALDADKESNCVLIFDEVDKVPAEVTAPLLEILQFKKINGKPLNIVSCILTGNLSDEGAFSNTISTALLDRGAKYILSFDFEKWIDWAKVHGIHDLIMAFLRSNPDLACGKNDEMLYASPSPRGWTQASEALIKAKELKILDIETITQIISGFVGEEAGMKFKIWYTHYRQFEPHVRNLLEDGTLSINFEELQPTEKLVFIITACYHAKLKVISDLSKSKSRLVSLEYLINFFKTNNVEKEMQVMGLYNSFDFDLITKHKLYTCSVFFEYFKQLNENIVINK